jgi:hypothetical protein
VLFHYLDSLEEREFDAPFIAMLRALRYFDIHFLHGAFEDTGLWFLTGCMLVSGLLASRCRVGNTRNEEKA